METKAYSTPSLQVSKSNEHFTCQKPPNTQRRKKEKECKRFSDEQIKSLESMFKLETKLEPRKKLQVARELGLQPRQVAIWFQNRRARWKSKQIEQEYIALKADYDNLKLKSESLNKEKQSLGMQIKMLYDQLNKAQDEGRGSKYIEGKSTDSGSGYGDATLELNGGSNCLRGGLDRATAINSDVEDRRNTSYLAQKEADYLSLGENVDGFTSFDMGSLSDQSCGTSSWWDFWN